MLTLQNISYIHSDGELLFDHICLSVAPKEKIAVIANNGAGKSTLLKIIAGQILPHTGMVSASSKLVYVPQIAGINIHNPEIVLLDEPTNHLDSTARNRLYRFVGETAATVVAVSHDRTLLNRLEKMCELNRHGMKVYGGNYDFYYAQKTIEREAFAGSLEEKQKALRKAKETEREALERQQKKDSQGRKNTEKGGLPLILAGARKNSAENSAAHLKGIHAGKVDVLARELSDLRNEIPDRDRIKFGFDHSTLHRGKILVKASAVNFAYDKKAVWENPLDFQILSGERIEISGCNGSGKTTLLRLILGDIEPTCGTIFRAAGKTLYIDQEYSLLRPEWTVYEQAQAFNDTALQEHEIKIRLNRFLFSRESWNKPCAALSGGERMRLLLCCMTITGRSPDRIVLDEPTNNIDINNMDILAAAVNDYRGTLIVVSHDACFLKQIHPKRRIDLDMQ